MKMQELLKQINSDFFNANDSSVIQSMVENEAIDAVAIQSGWLGFEPASQEMIKAKEQELGVQLPPSYREFLKITNGFRFISSFLDNLFPLERVDWARNTEESWWFDMLEGSIFPITDEEYLNYAEQDCSTNRNEYYRQSLKIAEWYDGMCVFLNPCIKHGEEWEVLEYATWYPGAERYRSFKEYLLKVHGSNVELQKTQQCT